jgi:hypothetical protein
VDTNERITHHKRNSQKEGIEIRRLRLLPNTPENKKLLEEARYRRYKAQEARRILQRNEPNTLKEKK